MPRHTSTGLAVRVLKGDVQAAARLISLLEDGAPGARAEVDSLYPHSGRAHVIGFTGAPGVGKSSLVDCLAARFRRDGRTVGVIAIDPTSAITGGALLGDRVRMQRHCADPGVFIRSLATRGWAGGLARAATGAVRVMDALGRDVVIVETVGSGQVELDIARAADTTVLVMAPGAGDEVQAMKAGIIEVADIISVNKADQEGADRLKADLEAALGTSPRTPPAWQTPVVLTDALHEKGIDGLAETIVRHRIYLDESGDLTRRRQERARLELLGAVEAHLRDALDKLKNDGSLDAIVDDVRQGRKTTRAAALEIVRLDLELLEKE